MKVRQVLRIFVCEILLLALLIGCGSSGPGVRAWRPWVRTYESKGDIAIGAIVTTSVEGENRVLIGDDRLRNESIRKELDRLIERRGFQVKDSSGDFLLKLKFLSTSTESSTLSTWSATRAYGYSSSTVSTGRLGIVLASALAGNFTTSYSQSVLKTKTSYVHTLSLELTDRQGRSIRKSDIMWSSDDPDLSGRLIPALQVALVDLPRDDHIVVEIPEVDESRAVNFRRIYTDDRAFSCPALPLNIVMPKLRIVRATDMMGHFRSTKVDDNDPVESAAALQAYVDLIQTAEFAVPEGSNKWVDPLRTELWSKAMIGGRYRLSPSNRTVGVLVTMERTPDGYSVKRCWIASDAEFTDFENQLAVWKRMLREYYDVYRE